MPSLVPPAVAPGSLAGEAQPRLATDELTLRPWTAEDAPAVAAAYEDPEIRRWHVRTMTADEALAWTGRWSALWQSEAAASWAVVDADDGLLGRVGVQQLNLDEGLGVVAYWTVPAARGRRVASRALSAVTDWAFQDLGLHRLKLEHSTLNRASCQVAERAGYGLEGTARSQGLHADGWHDMHVHVRFASSP